MKMWQKIISAVLVVVLIMAVVWYFFQEQKDCYLCSSFRYHAPCLIDLQTGNLIELDLYFPHPTKVAELADSQPKTSTLSFVHLGSVTGTRLTDSKKIEIKVPVSEITVYPALCKSCRKQLGGVIFSRYVLADLYISENKTMILPKDGLHLYLRCYEITTQQEENVLKLTIQGTLA